MESVGLSLEDTGLVAAFAGCSLDEKPGSNWIQDAGGLPSYVCEVARAVKRSGKSTSQAIAIAVSRIKKWAATGEADTKAKAAKALAQWEALKAKSGSRKVAASRTDHDVVSFCAQEFNVDVVRKAFDNRLRAARQAWRVANPNQSSYDAVKPDFDLDSYPSYAYIRETWTTFVIVEVESSSGTRSTANLWKVGFNVDPKDSSKVTFRKPEKVRVEYVTEKDLGSELTDSELLALMELSALPVALSRVVGAARVGGMHEVPTSDLEKVELAGVKGFWRKVGGKSVWVKEHHRTDDGTVVRSEYTDRGKSSLRKWDDATLAEDKKKLAGEAASQFRRPGVGEELAKVSEETGRREAASKITKLPSKVEVEGWSPQEFRQKSAEVFRAYSRAPQGSKEKARLWKLYEQLGAMRSKVKASAESPLTKVVRLSGGPQ